MTNLRNTAKTIMTVIGNERITEIFQADAGIQISLPVSVYDAYRLTLITPSGYVLWDSHIADGLVNHIDREEVIAALEGREGSSMRDSISTRMKRIYYALPVYDNFNNITGVFRLSVSIPGFGARVSPVFLPFAIFICLFIIAAFWLIIMYSRSLSMSLERLVSIAQTSSLLLSEPEAVEHAAPEFRSLEKALRAMTEELNLRLIQAKSEGSRLEAILNGMSEAVFAMDHALKLHMVNPRARELFNLGSRSIKNMSLLEATRSAELAEIAKKAIACGAPFETELTFHTGLALLSDSETGIKDDKDGGSLPAGEVHFQVYASPLHMAPDAAGVILVLQDITRLVKLEKVRKDFVANVSHELRTPIQLIKGFSETLLDTADSFDGKSKKQVLHFSEIILKNAGVMESLTNELLVLADIENNSPVNERELKEEDIASIVNEAAVSVEPYAKKKQIEINIKCQDDLKARLFGSLVIQALINLLDNGIKYSSPKSALWLNAFVQNDVLIFEVRDKGIGVSSEHLERIFERFYRVDRSRGAADSGQRSTGLGLSIVRHIALLHKGSAEAESTAGKGSVFRIKIPYIC